MWPNYLVHIVAFT
ncbi:hypothetical protein F383_34878 [Gossypium arboreum]|uniref:Uncharacterized protein n=1 Tax=Gossypium arboreum TaxID=29729 RepID=A0A0B0N653_GOSAR|nr:hypothetical protein F383_34878 [Gossypium arboreum]